jgi:hypothetical protein
MIKMKMRQEHVRYIIAVKTMFLQRFIERIISMQIIVTEKLLILFISHPCINEDQPMTIFDQQTSQRPRTHIVFVRRVDLLPDAFRYNAKHGTTIQFEVTRIDGV